MNQQWKGTTNVYKNIGESQKHMLSKISQIQESTQCMYSYLYIYINFKNAQNKPILIKIRT